MRTELTKCGAKVIEEGDTLTVYPSELHGAEIETYNDHRMAMCFAILGLKVPGIKIKNPACVKKTFPNFFQKLAAAPPHGLGVEIRDGQSRAANLEGWIVADLFRGIIVSSSLILVHRRLESIKSRTKRLTITRTRV